MERTYTNQAQIGDVLELEAYYVVTDAKYAGGGQAHNDIIPDSWHVTAKKLTSSGKYNQKGKEIAFYQEGPYTGVKKEVAVIGKMKQTFVPVDGLERILQTKLKLNPR